MDWLTFGDISKHPRFVPKVEATGPHARDLRQARHQRARRACQLLHDADLSLALAQLPGIGAGRPGAFRKHAPGPDRAMFQGMPTSLGYRDPTPHRAGVACGPNAQALPAGGAA